MRKDSADIKERCVEELHRVFPSHINLANRVGSNTNHVLLWWDGEQVPSPAYLHVLDQLGVDIYYVITGKRTVKSNV